MNSEQSELHIQKWAEDWVSILNFSRKDKEVEKLREKYSVNKENYPNKLYEKIKKKTFEEKVILASYGHMDNKLYNIISNTSRYILDNESKSRDKSIQKSIKWATWVIALSTILNFGVTIINIWVL